MKPEIWDWLQNHYFSVAQPVLKNTAGIYPLILASQQGRSDVVNFLIEQNAAWMLLMNTVITHCGPLVMLKTAIVLRRLLMLKSILIVKIPPRALLP